MNIQDVAEFLDLVKNPEKYESMLARLVEEQERLKAVIETVGLVSEIEQIHADMLKAEQVALASFSKKEADQEAKRVSDSAKYDAKYSLLLQDQQTYAALVEEQKVTLADTKLANKNVKQLEKESEAKLQLINEQQVVVEALRSEYEEKIAKLKSVMV